MFPHIRLHTVPIAFIIPDFLTIGTEGQKATQNLYLVKSVFKFADESLSLILCPLALDGIAYYMGLVGIVK